MDVNDEAVARRRALGIPVHVTDQEHEWRTDGYCNCGEKRYPATRRRYGRDAQVQRATSNIDKIEGNPIEGRH